VDAQEPALKTLIRERHLTYDGFCREWDRTARGVDDHLVGRWPGRAQYYRWLRGELVNGHPYPDACRMLEAMFAGPICGASMNPARSLSPAIVSGNITALWIYLTAPILGAALATLAWRTIK